MASNYFEALGQLGDPQTYQIIGAAMEVHRELKHGFLEAAYHEAMKLEMEVRAIPWQHEVDLVIYYKGTPLKCKYRADFVCFGDIIVELKAISQITGADKVQVINYLKATRFRRALILNFGTESLQFERVVLGHGG